jgi:DNA-binding CsgD family transcriptional regulator
MDWKIFNESLNLILHARNKAHAFELVERCSKLLGCSGLFVLHLPVARTVKGKTRTEIFSRRQRVAGMLERLKRELLSASFGPILDAGHPTHVADARLFLKERGLSKLARLAAVTQAHSLLVIPVRSQAQGVFCFVFVGPQISNDYTQVAALGTLAHVTIENLLSDNAPSKPLPENALSQRETECLRLMVIGKDDTEIATILGIAERTVRFHLDHARAKLGARNRAHAVAMVVGERLLEQ